MTASTAFDGRWEPTISGRYLRLRPGPGRCHDAVGVDQRDRLHAATVELVGERGYDALTVRGLSRLAGVSSGDFYRHFADVEDCFLKTHELLLEDVAEHLLATARAEADGGCRLTSALGAMARDLARVPRAARFLLISAPAAGPPRLAALRSSASSLGAAIELCLDRGTSPPLPPQLLEGIVAGILHLARTWLIGDRGGDPTALAAPAARWIRALRPADAHDHDSLSRLMERGGERTPDAPGGSVDRSRGAPAGDEREMILVAAVKLAARGGYRELSVPRVRRAAGVSRKAFDSHFEGVEDCFLAALRSRAARAISAATREARTERDWAKAVRRALESLCAGIARDPVGARASFVELFAAGPSAIEQRSLLISDVAELLRRGAPLSRVESEATTAAIWALLLEAVEEDPTVRVPDVLPATTYLALAPAIGASAALRTICEEQDCPRDPKATGMKGPTVSS